MTATSGTPAIAPAALLPHNPKEKIVTSIRDDRIALFGNLQSPATQQRYWDRVAEDVDWTVEGTHPRTASHALISHSNAVTAVIAAAICSR
jgi:hypothetical protein